MNIFNRNKPVVCEATGFIFGYCRKSKRDHAYIRKYRNVANKLAAFETSRDIKLISNTFNYDIAEDFIYFLKSQNLKTNTVRDIYGCACFMFRVMSRRGYSVDFSFEDMRIDKEDSTQVYLTMNEIKKIYSLKFKDKNTEIVRDLFIIGCFTGLRYSDFTRISASNFNGKVIKIKTKKTGEIVYIPANTCVRNILNKYNGHVEYIKSAYNFNCRIKTICKRAGITTKILVEYTRGYKVVSESKKKYELVGSHTARRSFATNAYLAGISTARIMLMTGHETEQSFFKYIRIQKTENAAILGDHPFFE